LTDITTPRNWRSQGCRCTHKAIEYHANLLSLQVIDFAAEMHLNMAFIYEKKTRKTF